MGERLLTQRHGGMQRRELSGMGLNAGAWMAIRGGPYRLLFDVPCRVSAQGARIDWLFDQRAGGATSSANGCTGVKTYAFRVRSRAKQLDRVGAHPNHRYPGVWSEPAPIMLSSPTTCAHGSHSSWQGAGRSIAGPGNPANHRRCGRLSPGPAGVASRGAAAGLAVAFIPKIVRRKPTRRITNS